MYQLVKQNVLITELKMFYICHYHFQYFLEKLPCLICFPTKFKQDYEKLSIKQHKVDLLNLNQIIAIGNISIF
jgi:hypothetical protein